MADYYVADSRFSDLVGEIESLPGPWPDGLNIDWISRRIWVFKVAEECPEVVVELISAQAKSLFVLESEEQ